MANWFSLLEQERKSKLSVIETTTEKTSATSVEPSIADIEEELGMNLTRGRLFKVSLLLSYAALLDNKRHGICFCGKVYIRGLLPTIAINWSTELSDHQNLHLQACCSLPCWHFASLLLYEKVFIKFKSNWLQVWQISSSISFPLLSLWSIYQNYICLELRLVFHLLVKGYFSSVP